MAAEASLVLKRLREEEEEETSMTTKRHKYSHYNQILSLLDDQDYGEEPSLLIHDNVSSLITTLQHELSSHDHQHPADPTLLFSSSSSPAAIDSSSPSSNSLVSKCNHEEAEVEEDLKDQGVENVLRRLVEASDDELGIPNYELIRVEAEDDQLGGLELLFCDNMWEFEDITANYYDSFLQFEQFI